MKEELITAMEIRRIVDTWDNDLQERFAFRAKSLSASMSVPDAIRQSYSELKVLHEEEIMAVNRSAA